MSFKTAAFFAAAILTLVLAPFAAHAAAPTVINNTKTDEHKELFGLPLFLKPEDGFDFEKIADGCVDKVKKVEFKAAQIRLGYDKVIEGFSSEKLKKSGMDAKDSVEFIINGSRATLFKMFQKTKGAALGKWVMIIDRGENSWMVNGSYDSKDSPCAESVLKMIKSLCWDTWTGKTMDSAPLGNVSVAGTPMKQAGIADGAFVYTKDGKLPTKSPDGALFVVSRSRGVRALTHEQRLAFAREKMHDVDKNALITIGSEATVNFDGLPGVELTGYTDDAEKKLIYITVLFDSKDAHVMAGLAQKNTVENSQLFHDLSKTYKLGR